MVFQDRASGVASAILLLTLLSAMAGCGVSSPRSQNTNPVLDNDTVVMLDKKVTTQLARQNEWVEWKNDFLEAHVVLRNLGGRTLQVEIMTYFKDEHGGNISSSMDVWDSVTINPHEDFHYQRISHSKKAQSYQFHIRLGKESR